MTLKLRDATPVGERLKPPATEDELRWFRKKRQTALRRTALPFGGMCVLYYLGSLLRDGHYAGHVFPIIGFGVIAVTQAWLVIRVAITNDLVKEIQAKRSTIDEEQRKRIFLAALDDDVQVE